MSFAIRTPVVSALRGRLTVWHLSILTATLTLFAVLCYGVLSRSLYGHHDEELARQADDLIRALNTNPLTDSDIRRVLLETPIASRFVMVRNNRGELMYRDPALDSTEPTIGQHEALVHAAATASRSATFFTVALEQSGDVRFVCTPITQADAYLQIGDPLGDVRDTLRTVAFTCLPLIPVVLVLSGAGGWLTTKRALAPVRTIATTLQNIQATDLSRRVEVDPPDAELSDLVSTLNRLLDRLQEGFESLRQFAGDVSHQIQTPLTIMKGALDVARRDPGRTSDPTWLTGLADEVEDIRAIVVDLQSLALAGRPITGAVPVNLAELVEEACDIIAALGEQRDVTVRRIVQSNVTVHGDPTRLKQVVLNLGDNAVKYTPAGGTVDIQLGTAEGKALLRVTDTGIGISAQHLPRVFDRFFRAESAGHRAEGTGLGLAIVKRIVDVHAGTVDVSSQPGAGSTFTVSLPIS